MLERFTDAARHAIASAGDLARSAGTDEVTPVHLLGGLAADVGTVGSTLEQAGVTPERVLAAARGLSGASGRSGASGPSMSKRMAFSPQASFVIEGSLRVSRERQAARIDTSDLLLSLLARPADAGPVLDSLDVDADDLRRALRPGAG